MAEEFRQVDDGSRIASLIKASLSKKEQEEDSSQFSHITDLIGGALPEEGTKPLSKEELFRSMASEHLLTSIGVDIDKFRNGPQPAAAQPTSSGLGQLFQVNMTQQKIEEDMARFKGSDLFRDFQQFAEEDEGFKHFTRPTPSNQGQFIPEYDDEEEEELEMIKPDTGLLVGLPDPSKMPQMKGGSPVLKLASAKTDEASVAADPSTAVLKNMEPKEINKKVKGLAEKSREEFFADKKEHLPIDLRKQIEAGHAQRMERIKKAFQEDVEDSKPQEKPEESEESFFVKKSPPMELPEPAPIEEIELESMSEEDEAPKKLEDRKERMILVPIKNPYLRQSDKTKQNAQTEDIPEDELELKAKVKQFLTDLEAEEGQQVPPVEAGGDEEGFEDVSDLLTESTAEHSGFKNYQLDKIKFQIQSQAEFEQSLAAPNQTTAEAESIAQEEASKERFRGFMSWQHNQPESEPQKLSKGQKKKNKKKAKQGAETEIEKQRMMAAAASAQDPFKIGPATPQSGFIPNPNLKAELIKKLEDPAKENDWWMQLDDLDDRQTKIPTLADLKGEEEKKGQEGGDSDFEEYADAEAVFI